MHCKNQGCGFDFDKSGLTIDLGAIVRHLPPGSYEARIAPTVYCPICRSANQIDLKKSGILCRPKADGSASYIRWLVDEKDRPRAQDAGKIRAGERFTLLLPGLENMTPGDICYPAVPVFAQVGGKRPATPALPIRKEYFDIVDDKAIARDGLREPEQQGVSYSLTGVPLKGYPAGAPTRFSLPVLPARPDDGPGGAVELFQGIQLAIWPNLPYRRWERFFIRLTAADGIKRELFQANRKPHLFFWQDGKWQEAERTAADGVSLLAVTDARPEWLALEFGSGSAVVGGGIFRFPPATQDYAKADLTLAIDFGTSNTCIAYGSAAEPQNIQFSNCDALPIDGAAEEPLTDCVNTWPLRAGFGPDKSFLPTELITNRPEREVTGSEQLAQWKPVVDFGIPQPTVTGRYSEAGYIISEFKWTDREHARGWGGETLTRFQEYYLEYALLQALAQVAARGPLADTIALKYSFPLAFSENQKDSLEICLNGVRERLAKATNLTINVAGKLDEAMAAGLAGDKPPEGDLMFVDIGGGSTDVAFLHRDANLQVHPLFLTSFHYAGGSLVQALASRKTSSSCLSSGCTIEMFRRRIRDSRTTKEVLLSKDVIQPDRRNAAKQRTDRFYLYLMEYLARLIAARVILRELQPDIPIADDYCVALYPLGNGWGFGAYLDDNYASLLCRDLASRVGEILDQFEAREPEKPGGYVRPRTVQVKAHSLGRIHPKSAVAFGLLRGASVTHVKRNFIWRKILGHDLKSSEGRYPWFLPLDTNSTPPFGKRLPTGVKDFKYPPDGEPKMPENMYRPHQLEELMPSNGLWDAMVRRLPPDATVKKWFGDSPLEIMIEKLYGPSLENEI